jgi:hypothetical protein
MTRTSLFGIKDLIGTIYWVEMQRRWMSDHIAQLEQRYSQTVATLAVV